MANDNKKIKNNGSLTKKHTDHLSIMVDVKLPVTRQKKAKSKPIINFKSEGGWERYAKISDSESDRVGDGNSISTTNSGCYCSSSSKY